MVLPGLFYYPSSVGARVHFEGADIDAEKLRRLAGQASHHVAEGGFAVLEGDVQRAQIAVEIGHVRHMGATVVEAWQQLGMQQQIPKHAVYNGDDGLSRSVALR